MTRTLSVAAAVAAVVLLPGTVWGQLVVKDDFTGAKAQNTWKASNGACLTAGDGTGSIPACANLAYYTETLVGGATGKLPDTVGNGALRFTNGSPGGYNQNGAIVSQLSPAFNTKQGIQVTFTTETYRGNSGGGGQDGADGISFFLMDASQPAGIGAFGGSLGYSCSNGNAPYDGLVGGYIAVGVDEYGNFLNGTANGNGPNGPDNTATGWGYQPGRIGLRGAGSIAWAWLHKNYPTLYPSSLATTLSGSNVPYSWLATQDACKTGLLSDYSDPGNPKRTTTAVMDYPAIPNAYTVLGSGIQIANESAQKRGDGTPITYKLKITSDGLLSFSYSLNGAAFQPVITGQNITTSNGKLPDGLQFGFAGSTGGSTNIHEIMCFQAAPADVSASSVGLNQQQGAKVQSGTQVYFAFYNPTNWAGGVTANGFIDINGTLAISQVANWDASCVLTGVAAGQTCPTTGGGPVSAEGPTQRTILSFNDNSRTGVTFQLGNLSSNQQTALNRGDATASSDRLNYLRGDRSNEVTAQATGKFRARASVLGDILDSSPMWVGPPSGPYGATWVDALYPSATMPENSGQGYQNFATGPAKTRLNVVYTGANDGFLHGFRAGSFKADGTYDGTLNDGSEVMAYMPGAIVYTIHNSTSNSLDFADPHYGHNLYVDATPGTGDVFFNSAWHTWLIGGLGGGGPGIYVLDITDPNAFAGGNPQANVIAEWTPATIPGGCANSGNCGDNMGNISGVPQIRRFHNGNWGAVVGNGLNSASGDAGIFIIMIDKTSGTPSLYYFSATHNSKGSPGNNGIVFATAADLDGDHTVDYIYAGDLKGHIWRFDVTNSSPSQWAAGSALFTTGNGQPITTKPIVVSIPSAQGSPRVMVEFGTGQQTPVTNTTQPTYATGTQALYGIWDWNMSSWNAMPSNKYASATGLAAGATLVKQTISSPATGFRSVTNSSVCWQDAPGCTSTPQYGWEDDLPDTSTSTTGSNTTTVNNEQMIYSPILELGAFIVNTTIPAVVSPATCTVTTPTGWTMAINPANGGSFPTSFFQTPQGTFSTIENHTISGVGWNGTGSPTIVVIGDPPPGPGGDPALTGTYMATQTSNGGGKVGKVNPPAGTKGGRLTWIERR